MGRRRLPKDHRGSQSQGGEGWRAKKLCQTEGSHTGYNYSQDQLSMVVKEVPS